MRKIFRKNYTMMEKYCLMLLGMVIKQIQVVIQNGKIIDMMQDLYIIMEIS